MILSFSKKFPWGQPTNFEQKIIEGTKIHTIREDLHDRWKPGMKIHAATGVRTKKYNCFYEDECVSIQQIEIKYPAPETCKDICIIKVDGVHINFESALKLIKNDGFEGFEDFTQWFDSDFKGKLIHWTDLRYQ